MNPAAPLGIWRTVVVLEHHVLLADVAVTRALAYRGEPTFFDTHSLARGHGENSCTQKKAKLFVWYRHSAVHLPRRASSLHCAALRPIGPHEKTKCHWHTTNVAS